jgi:site-specific DNA-methyltransferase (adenine-specific)
MTTPTQPVREEVRILQGDCIERMAEMEDASVDAVICDPPYGLSREPDIGEVLTHWLAGDDHEHRGGGFMGQSWDSFVPGPAVWREAFRVLKPGGHLLAFAGTRTADLMGISIRMAGFEIRDSLLWLYGSGFPKSLDVSKAIDKAAGAEREDLGESTTHHGGGTNVVYAQDEWTKENFSKKARITAPATPEAAKWEGWGTALKPSHEPIVVARKPLIGTVAANVLEHGTGGLNIDDCRIEGDNPSAARRQGAINHLSTRSAAESEAEGRLESRQSEEAYRAERPGELLGRWPANVVLSEEAAAELDAQTGDRLGNRVANDTHGDSGGASRFFPTFGFSTMEICPLHGAGSIEDANTSVGKRKANSGGSLPTGGSGSRSTVPSQPGTTSTTETTTRSTTTPPTSSSSNEGDTSDTTEPSEPPRSSETEGAVALSAESGSLLPSLLDEPTHLDSPTAPNAAVCTCAIGASATESDTTPTCAPTELDRSPDAPRFRYCAKTSRAERNAGLEGFEPRAAPKLEGGDFLPADRNTTQADRRAPNHHPTVKPINLMRWLCRLVTPPGGLILDPFLGSGTTGCAAALEGFDFVGIEREPEYIAIAEARIAFWSQHQGRETKDVLKASKKRRPSVPTQQQLVAA